MSKDSRIEHELGPAQASSSIEAPDSPFLNVSEAAAYLRLSISKVRKEVHAKKIKHCKHGSRVLFRREFLDDWSEAQQVQPTNCEEISGLFGRRKV